MMFDWHVIGEFFTRDSVFWIVIDRMMTLLPVFAAMVAWLFWSKIGKRLRRWLAHNRFADIGGELDGTPIDAVVFTVSPISDDLLKWTIEKLNPKVVGLLHSSDSEQRARAIAEHCQKQKPPIRVFRRNTEDADDIALARRYTSELLQEAKKLEAASLAVDITGGKKPMSVGAFMAAEEAGARSIYTTNEYVKRGDQYIPRPGKEKILVLSKPQATV
jgi:hypothetical protein